MRMLKVSKKSLIVIASVVVVIGGLVSLKAVTFLSERDGFCESCHLKGGGSFNLYDENIPSHVSSRKEGSEKVKCAGCHADKTLFFSARRRTYDMLDLFNAATLTEIYSQPARSVFDYSKECTTCHPDWLEHNECDSVKLEGVLSIIGLRYDHDGHSLFEDFDPEEREELEMLLSKKELMEEEKERLELLRKIQVGSCAECHERRKFTPAEGTTLNKNINIIAREPMKCTSCHEGIERSGHPKEAVLLPPVEVCRRCHHGKLHGKILFFKAECESKELDENCVKCHPGIYNRESPYVMDRAFKNKEQLN